jgi:hypothetical protein
MYTANSYIRTLIHGFLVLMLMYSAAPLIPLEQ